MKKRYLSARLSDPILAVLSSLFFRAPSLVLRGWIRNLALAICLGGVSVAAAATGQNADAIGEAPEAVTFAVPDAWPWAYEDKDGRPQGSLVDVINRLSQLTDVPVEARIRPVRRAIVELNSGEVNFSILFQNPAQDRLAVNVAPLVVFDVMLATLASTDYPLNLEELSEKRVSFIRGTYLGEVFEENTRISRVPVALISQAVELLYRGRISAIMASDHALTRTLQAMELSPDVLRYHRQVPDQIGALYMSRKAQRPGVAEKFRKAIARMTETNELNKIFFGQPGRPQYDEKGQKISDRAPESAAQSTVFSNP